MYKNAIAGLETTTRAKFVQSETSENCIRGETSQVSQSPKKFSAPYVVLPYYVKVS